ncbi:MAG: hypothetical protein F6K31_05445 [Symploca sp. SIO2G7]|nr:hypothetical protein [Symploca sp. SIO2G7]
MFKFVIGHLSFVICPLSLVICYLLFVIGHLLFGNGKWRIFSPSPLSPHTPSARVR